MSEKDSVYKFIELVGTSKTSWEEAARNAVERASKTLRDTRVAEIKELDMRLDDGKSFSTGRRFGCHSSTRGRTDLWLLQPQL
jgi:dodecin